MAKTDKITIEINKDIAKEAYEAGARWAFNDEDGILTIEGFETFWAKIESGLANVDKGESTTQRIPRIPFCFIRCVSESLIINLKNKQNVKL